MPKEEENSEKVRSKGSSSSKSKSKSKSKSSSSSPKSSSKHKSKTGKSSSKSSKSKTKEKSSKSSESSEKEKKSKKKSSKSSKRSSHRVKAAPSVDSDDDDVAVSRPMVHPRQFKAVFILSDEMAEFVGKPCMSRADLIKVMWSYVKEKQLLQKNKSTRFALCDRKLRKLFDCEEFDTMFLYRYLAPHLREVME